MTISQFDLQLLYIVEFQIRFKHPRATCPQATCLGCLWRNWHHRVPDVTCQKSCSMRVKSQGHNMTVSRGEAMSSHVIQVQDCWVESELFKLMFEAGWFLLIRLCVGGLTWIASWERSLQCSSAANYVRRHVSFVWGTKDTTWPHFKMCVLLGEVVDEEGGWWWGGWMVPYWTSKQHIMSYHIIIPYSHSIDPALSSCGLEQTTFHMVRKLGTRIQKSRQSSQDLILFAAQCVCVCVFASLSS